MGRRADRPRLDPGRPARGELRDIHGRLRCADLRRQRLRRSLCRALHLGSSAVRGQRRVDVLAEGALGRGDRRTDRDIRPRLHRAGSVVRRCRGRLDLLAQSGNRPRRGVVRAAHGTAVDEAGNAGPHDPGRRLRSAVPGSARSTPTRRRRTRQGRRRLRALPADDSGDQALPWDHLRREGRDRQDRLRHRQRRPAHLHGVDRGFQPGAGQRRRAVDQAGQRRSAQPGGRRPRRARVLPPSWAPHRGLAAGAAGARRSVARLHRYRRRRLCGQRALAVRGRPRLERIDRAGRTGGGHRATRSGGREGALRQRRRQRPVTGRLPDRGGDRRGDRTR